jgi:RNA polymerase sigma-70 factor (ECF subfamily)
VKLAERRWVTEGRGKRLRSRRPSTDRSLDDTERLFRAAYALCGSWADVEELVLEAFASAISRRRFVRSRGDAVHLMRALRRTWIDHQCTRPARPAATRPPEPIDWVVDPGADPHVLALDVQRAYDAIGKLSPQQREAIAAVDVLGLSPRDAARALRIHQHTLTSRLYHAREGIAAVLKC